MYQPLMQSVIGLPLNNFCEESVYTPFYKNHFYKNVQAEIYQNFKDMLIPQAESRRTSLFWSNSTINSMLKRKYLNINKVVFLLQPNLACNLRTS